MTFRAKFLIDGGYLSWVYGASPWGVNAWNSARSQYGIKSGGLFLLDSPSSQRKAYDITYKAHRAERAAKDEKKQQAHENVKIFRRDILDEDPTLRSLQVEGLEADDLIAIALYSRVMGRNCRVIGADKDLLQIPDDLINLEHCDGTSVKISNFAAKCNRNLSPLIHKPWHILLTLVLMGDSADNIPRITPSRGYQQIIDLYSSAKPFTGAWERFGDDVLENIWLTLLPYPGLLDPIPSKQELPSILDQNLHQLIGGDLKIHNQYLSLLDQVLMPLEQGQIFDFKGQVIRPTEDLAITSERSIKPTKENQTNGRNYPRTTDSETRRIKRSKRRQRRRAAAKGNEAHPS